MGFGIPQACAHHSRFDSIHTKGKVKHLSGINIMAKLWDAMPYNHNKLTTCSTNSITSPPQHLSRGAERQQFIPHQKITTHLLLFLLLVASRPPRKRRRQQLSKTLPNIFGPTMFTLLPKKGRRLHRHAGMQCGHPSFYFNFRAPVFFFLQVHATPHWWLTVF